MATTPDHRWSGCLGRGDRGRCPGTAGGSSSPSPAVTLRLGGGRGPPRWGGAGPQRFTPNPGAITSVVPPNGSRGAAGGGAAPDCPCPAPACPAAPHRDPGLLRRPEGRAHRRGDRLPAGPAHPGLRVPGADPPVRLHRVQHPREDQAGAPLPPPPCRVPPSAGALPRPGVPPSPPGPSLPGSPLPPRGPSLP